MSSSFPPPSPEAASAQADAAAPAAQAIWQPRLLHRIAFSSLRDTLHAGSHTRDFTLARTEYLRNRVLVCGVLFALLTPLWLLIDFWLLPASALAFVIPGRFFLLGGLLATLVLAYRGQGRVTQIRLATGLLIALPAAFYGLILISLPPGQMHLLVGYAFIPYLLVAVLSIFPFTLTESATAGLALLVLECLAQQQSGTWLTPAGWQGLWLLGVLLAIAMTANHFHLNLLLRLYRQATHDPLTGLLNRRALQQVLGPMRKRPDSNPIGLMMLDIDHFKRLNDEHGHAFGDRVLQKLATVLNRAAGSQGLAARYGGEEFLLVLPGVSAKTLAERAEALRAEVARLRLLDFDRQPTPFTISLGLALMPADAPLEQSLRQADARLYQAKAAGRNQVMAA